MNQNNEEHPRIIAVYPSTRGFGFAVLEGNEILVNWGNKSAKGDDKNEQCLKKIKELIAQYKPEVMVLEDCSVKGCRRRARVRTLIQAIIDLAPAQVVSVALCPKEKGKQVFLPDGKGTKHDVAKILAERFPEELGHLLPPKRKFWKNEDSRMDIFEAIALVMAVGICKASVT